MRFLNKWIAAAAFASLITTGAVPVRAGQAAATKTDAPAKSGKMKKAASAPTPTASASDIAAAKASGKVWVNTETKVYHKDGQFYGATKRGKFMAEADAQKAGYRAAKSK